MSVDRTDLKKRTVEIIRLLEKEHPDAKTALRHSNPLELLVATILSAQCTDEKVNEVTRILFKKYHKPEDYARADVETFEQEIRSTGFYHNKAKNIKRTAQMLVDEFHSKVPRTMEELLLLPGVARKTANIVLSNSYGMVEGIAVDTHVRRLARRLDLTKNSDQDKIEKDLMEVVPKEKWSRFSDLLIFHGRRICNARNPKCVRCVLNEICPSAFTFNT